MITLKSTLTLAAICASSFAFGYLLGQFIVKAEATPTYTVGEPLTEVALVCDLDTAKFLFDFYKATDSQEEAFKLAKRMMDQKKCTQESKGDWIIGPVIDSFTSKNDKLTLKFIHVSKGGVEKGSFTVRNVQ